MSASRVFNYNISDLNEHNTLVIRSLVDGLIIKSVWTIDYQNVYSTLVGSPIIFNGLQNYVGVSYASIRSQTLYLDIEVTDDSLTLDELVEVLVTDTVYKTSGTYRSQYYNLNAGKNIQAVYKITNNSAALIDCYLDIKFYDIFSNIRAQYNIPLLVNPEGKLVYTSNKKDIVFTLPLRVTDLSRINIFVDSIQIPEANYSFSLLSSAPNAINFDSRNIDEFTVVYVPDLYTNSSFTKLDNNISMNKDNLIVHNIKDISTIQYRYVLNMINLDPQLIDQSPIIQTLGLVTY